MNHIMKARISHMGDTLIIELPKRDLSDPLGYVLIDTDPHFLEIENIGWIDPSLYKHKEMIRGNYGTFQREDPTNFIPLVRLPTLLDEPKPGRSFYGLVSFIELATPSDYLKGKRIMGSSVVTTINGDLMVVGEGEIISRGYYHSWPVVKVEELDIYRELEQICMVSDIDPREKFLAAHNLLTRRKSIKLK